MKKRILFSVVALCLVFSFGCVKKPITPVTPIVSPADATQNAEITALKAQVATLGSGKAENASLTDAVSRITTLEGQSAANTYTKAQLYTQAEVNTKIADAIKALKDDQSWVTGRTSTSSDGTVTGDYGELIDEDGDLQLWLEQVSGDVSDEFRTREDENEGRFDLVVVNLDDSSHDFRIYFDFEPDATVVLSDNSSFLDTAKTEARASGGLDFTVSRSPNSGRSLLSADQSNNGRILKGDAEDYTVWVTIDQVDDKVVDWDYDIRIKDKD